MTGKQKRYNDRLFNIRYALPKEVRDRVAKEKIEQLCIRLTEREQRAVMLRYNGNNQQLRTYRDIGIILNMSTTGAEKLVKRGLRKIVERSQKQDNQNQGKLNAELLNMFRFLTEREKQAIQLKMGFINDHPYSYDAIGQLLGITKARAHRLVKRALFKLRRDEDRFVFEFTPDQKELIARILFENREINQDTDCWEWTGCRTRQGYGALDFYRIIRLPAQVVTHRLAAHIWNDFDINSDLLVCHRCDNPPCFNPDHLFQGTHLDNSEDAARKGRTTGSVIIDKSLIERIINLIEQSIPYGEIATRLGVSVETVSRVGRGKTRRKTLDELHWVGRDAKTILSDEDVVQIRELLRIGHRQIDIAQIFGVHYSTISRIKNGSRRQNIHITT